MERPFCIRTFKRGERALCMCRWRPMPHAPHARLPLPSTGVDPAILGWPGLPVGLLSAYAQQARCVTFLRRSVTAHAAFHGAWWCQMNLCGRCISQSTPLHSTHPNNTGEHEAHRHMTSTIRKRGIWDLAMARRAAGADQCTESPSRSQRAFFCTTPVQSRRCRVHCSWPHGRK